MEQKTREADQIVEYFKQQVLLLKEKALLQASLREEKKLLVENAKLKKDIDDLKKVLQEKQKRRSAKQASPPIGSVPAQCPAGPSTSLSATPAPLSSAVKNPSHKHGEAQTRKPDKREKRERKQCAVDFEETKVDMSRLDIRVGRIVTAMKHQDADSLFVQEVDVGEDSHRTVVSGLVKHVPLEQMQNRMAVFLCNLRPSKMRGVVSQAMMLCATSSEKVEILEPPSGASPGDRVTIQSFSGEPDKELNPKKKVWEQAQVDLHTDDRGVAMYKGVTLEVRGKGFCKAPTLGNCGIK